LKFPRRIFIAVLCVAAFAANAEESAAERYGAEYQTCRDGNTYEIVTCLSGLYKKWDERLNAAYQKLLGMQETPKQKTALVEAQKSWIKYRDQNCEWYETGEGTIRRLWGSECMRSMTAARALELEEAGETN
jgi:uncharacterized protein YecT (DUF1311 family)